MKIGLNVCLSVPYSGVGAATHNLLRLQMWRETTGHRALRVPPSRYRFGWLAMSVRRENWVYGSVCVIFVLFFILFIFNLLIAILFIIIGFLTIGIIYVIRTPDGDTPTEPPVSSAILTDTTPESPIHEPTHDQRLNLSPSTGIATKPTTDTSTEELKQRIAELENRIQLLNEQLAKDSAPSEDHLLLASDDIQNGKEITSEELSEKAIQHLLETLDEKLAKRAISKQLYTRLRDKYIVRMEKAKMRREASAKRGTKDSNSGDI